MPKPSLSTFDDLQIEVATHRLVIRAILVYLACTARGTAEQTMAEISGMLEGTGPYALIAEDLDDQLRTLATARARERVAQFISVLHKLPIARA